MCEKAGSILLAQSGSTSTGRLWGIHLIGDQSPRVSSILGCKHVGGFGDGVLAIQADDGCDGLEVPAAGGFAGCLGRDDS